MDNIKFIVASGSLPPAMPVEVFGQIAMTAKKINARLIVDTSGQALQHAVDQGVFLLKPNLNELSTLLNKKELKKDEIVKDARQLISKGSVEILVISLGAEGALLVTATECEKFTPPVVESKSTVGAGDSMLAGIVYSLAKGKGVKEAVRYGVACGTAATMNPGTDLCRLQDAEALFPMIKKSDSHLNV
jgi:6-phosphofructokinase 2